MSYVKRRLEEEYGPYLEGLDSELADKVLEMIVDGKTLHEIDEELSR